MLFTYETALLSSTLNSNINEINTKPYAPKTLNFLPPIQLNFEVGTGKLSSQLRV